MMKLPFFFCSLLCLICRLMAADHNSLEMTAEMSGGEFQEDRTSDDFSIGEGHRRYDFFVTLRNIGTQPLVVLKGSGSDFVSNEIVFENSEATYHMHCAWTFQEFDIPSESELGLVKLQNGEAASIHFAIRTNERIDHAKTTVTYAVAEKLAARFGTWGGRLETRVLSPTERLLLRDKQKREKK
jgi:hypothetical protein